MLITIVQTGEVPAPLRSEFGPYAKMFERMFDSTGFDFNYQVVTVDDNSLLPDPSRLEAIVITGSPAGVYEDHAWLPPLRDFIRGAYAAKTPMLGICFGHQIMADALGGDVQKSGKGWGLGRHTYRVLGRPDFMDNAPETVSVACSHQDQVLVPPADAEVILASDFTPNAGLFYKSGKALSFQHTPNFSTITHLPSSTCAAARRRMPLSKTAFRRSRKALIAKEFLSISPGSSWKIRAFESVKLLINQDQSR